MTILFILIVILGGVALGATKGASGSGSSGSSRQWTQKDDDELMAQLDNDLLDEDLF